MHITTKKIFYKKYIQWDGPVTGPKSPSCLGLKVLFLLEKKKKKKKRML